MIKKIVIGGAAAALLVAGAASASVLTTNAVEGQTFAYGAVNVSGAEITSMKITPSSGQLPWTVDTIALTVVNEQGQPLNDATATAKVFGKGYTVGGSQPIVDGKVTLKMSDNLLVEDVEAVQFFIQSK